MVRASHTISDKRLRLVTNDINYRIILARSDDNTCTRACATQLIGDAVSNQDRWLIEIRNLSRLAKLDIDVSKYTSTPFHRTKVESIETFGTRPVITKLSLIGE